MDRRTFFSNATVGVGATALVACSAKAMTPQQNCAKPPRRTAVSITVTTSPDYEVEYEIDTPPGFVPKAAACSIRDLVMTLDDDDESNHVLEVDGHAFDEGPLDLWRDVRGQLRWIFKLYGPPHVQETVVLTIYGEIPQQ